MEYAMLGKLAGIALIVVGYYVVSRWYNGRR